MKLEEKISFCAAARKIVDSIRKRQQPTKRLTDLEVVVELYSVSRKLT